MSKIKSTKPTRATKSTTTDRTVDVAAVVTPRQVFQIGRAAALVLGWSAGFCDPEGEAELVADVKAAYERAYERSWERHYRRARFTAAATKLHQISPAAFKRTAKAIESMARKAKAARS